MVGGEGSEGVEEKIAPTPTHSGSLSAPTFLTNFEGAPLISFQGARRPPGTKPAF